MSERSLLLFGTSLLLLAGSRVVAAQSITVNPLSTGPLTITTAVAGQEPTGVVAGGGTYRLRMRRNMGIGSITARLNTPLPPGTTLSITLASPGGAATSNGAVLLSTAAQIVVDNIPNTNTNYPSRSITYSFSATSAAGVLALQSVNVVLQLAP